MVETSRVANSGVLSHTMRIVIGHDSVLSQLIKVMYLKDLKLRQPFRLKTSKQGFCLHLFSKHHNVSTCEIFILLIFILLTSIRFYLRDIEAETDGGLGLIPSVATRRICAPTG